MVFKEKWSATKGKLKDLARRIEVQLAKYYGTLFCVGGMGDTIAYNATKVFPKLTEVAIKGYPGYYEGLRWDDLGLRALIAAYSGHEIFKGVKERDYKRVLRGAAAGGALAAGAWITSRGQG